MAQYIYLNMSKQMTDDKLGLFFRNTWNRLCAKKMTSVLFKNIIYKMCLQIIYI